MERRESEGKKPKITEGWELANKATVIITGLVIILFCLYVGYQDFGLDLSKPSPGKSKKRLDGFQGAKFCMKYEDLKKIIIKEGKTIIEETTQNFTYESFEIHAPLLIAKGLLILDKDNVEDIIIEYGFWEDEKRLNSVDITFNSRSLFNKVKAFVAEQYGFPGDDGISGARTQWGFKDGYIWVLEGTGEDPNLDVVTLSMGTYKRYWKGNVVSYR